MRVDGSAWQNLNNSSLIFYLLSNDHVNELITHRFDFQDEVTCAPPPPCNDAESRRS